MSFFNLPDGILPPTQTMKKPTKNKLPAKWRLFILPYFTLLHSWLLAVFPGLWRNKSLRLLIAKEMVAFLTSPNWCPSGQSRRQRELESVIWKYNVALLQSFPDYPKSLCIKNSFLGWNSAVWRVEKEKKNKKLSSRAHVVHSSAKHVQVVFCRFSLKWSATASFKTEKQRIDLWIELNSLRNSLGHQHGYHFFV